MATGGVRAMQQWEDERIAHDEQQGFWGQGERPSPPGHGRMVSTGFSGGVMGQTSAYSDRHERVPPPPSAKVLAARAGRDRKAQRLEAIAGATAGAAAAVYQEEEEEDPQDNRDARGE